MKILNYFEKIISIDKSISGNKKVKNNLYYFK